MAADLLTQLAWAHSGLNNLFSTKGSGQQVGLGDLLVELASGNSQDILATPLTGYVSAPGVITPADTILSAIEKLNGNQTSGDVTSLNGLTGALTLLSSSNLSVTPSGTSIALAVVPSGASGSVQYNNGSGGLGGGSFWTDGNNAAISSTYGLLLDGSSNTNFQIGRNLGILVGPYYSPFLNPSSGGIVQFVVNDAPSSGFIFGTSDNTHFLELDGQGNAFFQTNVSLPGTLKVGTLSGVLQAAAGVVSGGATTSVLPEGSNLYFTNARALASVLTGYVSSSGTITSSDTILSAIEKLNGNVANVLSVPLTGYAASPGTVTSSDTILSAFEKLGGNLGNYLPLAGGTMNASANILWATDNTGAIGAATASRPANVYAGTSLGAGLGSGQTGTLALGDQTSGASLSGTVSSLTLFANDRNSLSFDGNGNISFNLSSTIAANPFFSFGSDGTAVLGGYTNPSTHTFFRPGYMALKYALGIGGNPGETGTLQLGDATKGNNIIGTNLGELKLSLNNQRRFYIDPSANWQIDQDNPGGNPGIWFIQDGKRDIGQTNVSLRPRNIWVSNQVGIGCDNIGTLTMGSGGAVLTGDTSGNFNVTLGASGSLNMNSKKITNLEAGSNPNDAVNYSQINNFLPATLASGDIFVGNGSNLATGVVLSGDATLSNSGVLTLDTVNSNVGSFGSASSVPSFTVNGKGLITSASAAAVIAPAGTLSGSTLNSTVTASSLTSLGAQSQALNMNSNFINNLSNPTTAQQAATKYYVDQSIAGLTWKGPVNVYSTSNVALSGGATLTVDGYSVQNGNFVALNGQSTASQNGVYVVSGIGSAYILTLASAPESTTTIGDAYLVLDGTVYGNTAIQANQISPNITYIQFAGPTVFSFVAPLFLTGSTVTLPLANGDIFVGNGSGNATAVAMSGDVHISNTGATSIVATSNSTLTTLSALSLPVSQLTGTQPVTNGGTGLSSLTSYALLAGGTTGTGNVHQVSGVGTANQILTSSGSGALPAWQANGGVPVTLTVSGGSANLNANLGNTFYVTMTGATTINVPSNPTDGQKISIAAYSSGGSYQLTLSSSAGGFLFGSTITSLNATISGDTDYVGCIYNATIGNWLVVAYAQGF
jgi:hypothetical protein